MLSSELEGLQRDVGGVGPVLEREIERTGESSQHIREAFGESAHYARYARLGKQRCDRSERKITPNRIGLHRNQLSFRSESCQQVQRGPRARCRAPGNAARSSRERGSKGAGR